MKIFENYLLELINENTDLTNNYQIAYERLCDLIETNKSRYVNELKSDPFKFSEREVTNVLKLFDKTKPIPNRKNKDVETAINYFNKKIDHAAAIYPEVILPFYKIVISNQLEKEELLSILSIEYRDKVLEKINSVNVYCGTLDGIYNKCKSMYENFKELLGEKDN